MYIAPNSKIKIYHNVPLDNTYVHTLYFSSLNAQNNYFHGNSGILKYNLETQTYQRVNKGMMRVEINAENLYDCNYLAFQNTSFGTKWFYAFITSVEYVNNVTSEITFEIDPMQTYFFDVTLQESFVEREHTATDYVGQNLVDEKLDIGTDYVVNKEQTTNFKNNQTFCLVIACTETPIRENPSASDWVGVSYIHLSNGLPTGVSYVCFELLSENIPPHYYVPAWKKFIKAFVDAGKSDSILAMYVVPRSWLPNTADPFTYKYGYVDNEHSGGVGNDSYIGDVRTYTFTRELGTLNGYTPKNKKLYNYPYNFLNLTNGQGESVKLCFEYSNSVSSIDFGGYADFTLNASFGLYPLNYKKIGLNFDEGIVIGNVFQGSWTSDPYSVWLNQGLPSSGVTALSTMLSTALGLINPIFGGLAVAGNISSVVGNVLSEKMKPNTAKGSGSGNGLQIASNNFEIRFQEMCPKAEYLRIIDDYFTVYGYACRRHKVPNRNVRPHWTYTKTVGCNLIGNAPADDVKKLCEIYDKGITFWVNASEVGNYSLNNSL